MLQCITEGKYLKILADYLPFMKWQLQAKISYRLKNEMSKNSVTISSSVFNTMTKLLGMKHYMLHVQHAVINKSTFVVINKSTISFTYFYKTQYRPYSLSMTILWYTTAHPYHCHTIVIRQM